MVEKGMNLDNFGKFNGGFGGILWGASQKGPRSKNASGYAPFCGLIRDRARGLLCVDL